MTKTAYLCVGENFSDNSRIGDCGDVRSLIGWLTHITHRDATFLADFFDGFTDKEVCEYIYKNFGKRLKKAQG